MNAAYPICSTDDEINTFINNLHPLNTLLPILVTEEGMLISCNPKQLLKELCLISFIGIDKKRLTKSILLLFADDQILKWEILFAPNG